LGVLQLRRFWNKADASAKMFQATPKPKPHPFPFRRPKALNPNATDGRACVRMRAGAGARPPCVRKLLHARVRLRVCTRARVNRFAVCVCVFVSWCQAVSADALKAINEYYETKVARCRANKKTNKQTNKQTNPRMDRACVRGGTRLGAAARNQIRL
jgi:hypothetical protein